MSHHEDGGMHLGIDCALDPPLPQSLVLVESLVNVASPRIGNCSLAMLGAKLWSWQYMGEPLFIKSVKISRQQGSPHQDFRAYRGPYPDIS